MANRGRWIRPCTIMGIILLIIGSILVVIPSMITTAQASEDMGATALSLPGDPNIGRMLFTGEKRFANGGPPCISCHNVGIGALGGGTLGPNLVKPTWAKYKSLAAISPSQNPLLNPMWINNASTPVMGPIFSRRPILDEEVDNLKAFLTVMAQQPESSTKTGAFVGIGVAGFIGIMIFFGIVWSGRYRSRVGGTAHEAIWRNYGGKGGR